MTPSSILIRFRDDKPFRVFHLGHWSDITSDDGETRTVKWYGGDRDAEFYVDADHGEQFILYKDPAHITSGQRDLLNAVLADISANELALLETDLLRFCGILQARRGCSTATSVWIADMMRKELRL